MTSPRIQRVAAYLVCVDSRDRLLLCRLTEETGRPGWWTLPGGGIEFGEHPADAARRELREETGLDGRIGDVAAIDSIVVPVRDDEGEETERHGIRIVYRAEVTERELRFEENGTTDLASWFTREEATALPLVELGRLGAQLAWGG